MVSTSPIDDFQTYMMNFSSVLTLSVCNDDSHLFVDKILSKHMLNAFSIMKDNGNSNGAAALYFYD